MKIRYNRYSYLVDHTNKKATNTVGVSCFFWLLLFLISESETPLFPFLEIPTRFDKETLKNALLGLIENLVMLKKPRLI